MFVSFTPVVDCLSIILPEIKVGRYFTFRKTQKVDPVLKYDEISEENYQK